MIVEDVLSIGVLLQHMLEFCSGAEKNTLRCVSSRMTQNVDAVICSLKLRNLTANYDSLRRFCTQLPYLRRLELSSMCWNSNPLVFKALTPCRGVTDFHEIHIHCEKAAKEFVKLLRSQLLPLTRISLFVHGDRCTSLILRNIGSVEHLELHIRRTSTSDFTVLASILRRCGSRLKSLILDWQTRSSCSLSSCLCNFHKVFDVLIRHNKNLLSIFLDIPCLGSYTRKETTDPLSVRSLIVRNTIINHKWSSSMGLLNLQSLRHLEIQDVVTDTFEETILNLASTVQLPSLQSLACNNCWRSGQTFEPHVFAILLNNLCFRTLRTLKLEGQFLSAQAVFLLPILKDSLTCLSLASARIASLPFEILCSAIGQMGKLERLDISGVFLETGMDQMMWSLVRLKRLSHLNLTSSIIGALPLTAFVHANASVLESILLEYCIRDENDLMHFLRNSAPLPYLQKLNIVCYFTITASGEYVQLLHRILGTMPQLRQLSISAPSSVYLPRLIHTLQQCHKLRMLTLRSPIDHGVRYDHAVDYTHRTTSQGLPNVTVNVW